MLFENRGGGSVELLDDCLIVRREGKAAGAHEKQLAFSDIKSVQFREAGIASGYIQFCLGKRKVSGLSEALTDESTILFARELNDEFARLRDLVEERMASMSPQARADATNAQGRVARLERLDRLKASGTLDEAEFQAEKAKVLSEPAETAPGPSSWLVLAVLVAIAVVGAIFVGMWSSRKDEVPKPKSSLPTVNANEMVEVTPPPTPVKSVAERLADAFEAATGYRSTFSVLEDGSQVTTTPLRIVTLPFGEGLLTSRQIQNGCHACSGAIGVYYLKNSGGMVEVTGRWPNAVEGWGWGAPPSDWYFTSKFTASPAIYASGGFMGQGITGSSATITELTPLGPVTSDVIGTGYSDEGAIVDDERPVCVVEGRIANIVADQSFDVIVTGSVNAVDHYVKSGGKFVAASKINWELPCEE